MTSHQRRVRTGAFLAPLLAGTLTLAGAAPAQTATGIPSASDSPRNVGSYRAGTYVVKLANDPVATYEGGLPGLTRTAPDSGERLDADSRAAKEYLRHLDERRDDVLDTVPGVRKLYDYDYTLNGFAARLTGKQAEKLARTPGVVSVTASRVNRPAVDSLPADMRGPSTARGAGSTLSPGSAAPAARAVGSPAAPLPDVPRMLGLSGKKGLWSEFGGPERAGAGMIVGVVDHGFVPEHPLLAPLPEPRPDAATIAKKWRGTCDQGAADDPAHNVTCNNKVIGAAWFSKSRTELPEGEFPSPRDVDSHGTHVGTIIAGNHTERATIPGTNLTGTLTGLAPAARLAFYKACWDDGCQDVDTAAAIDRAVADGVDVLNYSIGGGLDSPTSMEAMRNAAEAGVFIAASAGNDGPDTVENTAPWITTVASTTHDTTYRSTLKLGDGRRFSNVGVTTPVPPAPLVGGADARAADADPAEAALCLPDTLDPARARGRIVICDRGTNSLYEKVDEVKRAGGPAAVIVNTPTSLSDFSTELYSLPFLQLSVKDGQELKAYAAKEGATAEFPGGTGEPTRAPSVVDWSSSGPDPFSNGDLIKPDIAAPGDLIVAGVVPNSFRKPGGPGQYGFMSGTSMASPQTAGLATLLKSLHPDWSPMEVQSALMTTATTTDNERKPIQRVGAGTATPLDQGAGFPRAARAADPGLVYDSTSADWTAYLCAVGLRPTTDAGDDACATAPKTDPSDLNRASIAVGDLIRAQTVTRTVTNVDAKTATYKATLRTPPGFKATVSPERLTVKPGGSATYKVTFTRTSATLDAWSFGSLTWSDAHSHHRVTSPVALRPLRLGAPEELTLGADGTRSAALTVRAGWNGDLTATTTGLYAGEKTTGTLRGVYKDGVDEAPPASDAIAKVRVHVPQDTEVTRVATTSADHLPGTDLDMYAFGTDGRLVEMSAKAESDEHVDLPPGDYDVYIVQYSLPEGATSQQFTFWTWQLGSSGAPDVPLGVSPATQPVPDSGTAEVTVTWPDVAPGERYMGIVKYGDGSDTVGRTLLTMVP
ncbi:S8 family serine peptidase [Streptomyces sp. NPDC000070]|uniref:S8 family serine peptidase n=1 Tax=Streptomyces sp. NPDC000070 TaxID=3154240 RepID=UPI00331ECBEC